MPAVPSEPVALALELAVPPPDATVQTTLAPLNGLPFWSLTLTTSGLPRGLPAKPDWLLPLTIAIEAGWLGAGMPDVEPPPPPQPVRAAHNRNPAIAPAILIPLLVNMGAPSSFCRSTTQSSALKDPGEILGQIVHLFTGQIQTHQERGGKRWELAATVNSRAELTVATWFRCVENY